MKRFNCGGVFIRLDQVLFKFLQHMKGLCGGGLSFISLLILVQFFQDIKTSV